HADAKYLYVITEDDKVKVLDYTKNNILNKDCNYVSHFDQQTGTFWVSNSVNKNNTEWTLLNSKGTALTKKNYLYPFEFEDNFAIGKTANGVDLINSKGDILLENQANIELNYNLIYIANTHNQLSLLDSTLKPIYPRLFKSYTILPKPSSTKS
ncbi:MAG: hypothetical protein K2X69_01250, partial [Silvanigrellaceae bacterium]|nr:hypothetical protein [Silvanigrellaceae bacterium]